MGQTFVESAACGTPAVGFAVSGVLDAITDGVTGCFASSLDSKGLAEVIGKLHAQPQLRRDLGLWGRLQIENEWSFASGYHRFCHGLVGVGLLNRLALPRRIALNGSASLVETENAARSEFTDWVPADGFGAWEGPYSQWNLPRCVWLRAFQGRIIVRSDTECFRRVVLRCLNYIDGQLLRVVVGETVLCETALEHCRDNSLPIHVSFATVLRVGDNPIDLFAWKMEGPPNNRQAILLLDVLPMSETADAKQE